MASKAYPPGLQPKPPIRPDPSKNRSDWYIFPDSLPTARFTGFQDRDNESLLRGAFVVGENVVMSSDFLPTIRPGFEPIGALPADSNQIQRAWVYETRDGLVYELKQDTSGKIWFWLQGVSTEWATLLSGMTVNAPWDFANIGVASDATNYVFFNNGIDDFYTFNGVYGIIGSAGANTLTIVGGGSWEDSGFLASTNKVRIGGITYEYTGGESSATLTGVTPDPNGVVTAGQIVVQAAQIQSSLSSFKSNILMAHDGRLHVVIYAKPTQWAYSVLDDPFDFSAGSSDGDGGLKEIELGGPIVALGKLNKTAIALKNRLVKSLTFQQFGARLDSPWYQTLTSTDDRSTSLGTISNKTICATPHGLAFITPDKRLVLLTGVTANDEPQYVDLGDPIQPIFDNGDFSEASIICIEDILWLSFKASSDSFSNDTVIRADMTRQTVTPDGKTIPCMWDLPFTGWNANDWTAVFNDDTGNWDAHFHSSLNSGSWNVIDDATDNTTQFTATCRTWAENFGAPYLQKRIDTVYVEVKMSQNTNLTLTLLYNENGVSQTIEYLLDGDDTNNRFNNVTYNPFGASPFGSQKFGSNGNIDELSTYRFYIKTNRVPPFFNISLQLSSDEEGQQWQLIRFGLRVAEILTEPDNFLLLDNT